MIIRIQWQDGPAEGTEDRFELDDLTQNTTGKIISHDVFYKRKFLGRAICIIKVTDSEVILDYEKFADINSAGEFIVGTMKLHINKINNKINSKVEWKDISEKEFTVYDCIISIKKQKKRSFEIMNQSLNDEVEAAGKLSSEQRVELLKGAPELPIKMEVTTSVFKRNPLVIAERLYLASLDGYRCQTCKKPAPFSRISTGQPYLEVHHIVHLANEGKDTVDNTIALCPDCHRNYHHGPISIIE